MIRMVKHDSTTRLETLPGWTLQTCVRYEIAPKRRAVEPLKRQRRLLDFFAWLGIVTALACGLAAVCVWDAFTGGPK